MPAFSVPLPTRVPATVSPSLLIKQCFVGLAIMSFLQVMIQQILSPGFVHGGS